jgi:hypothetical protein
MGGPSALAIASGSGKAPRLSRGTNTKRAKAGGKPPAWHVRHTDGLSEMYQSWCVMSGLAERFEQSTVRFFSPSDECTIAQQAQAVKFCAAVQAVAPLVTPSPPSPTANGAPEPAPRPRSRWPLVPTPPGAAQSRLADSG